MKATISIKFTDRVYGGLPKAKNLLHKFIEAKGEIPEEGLTEKEQVLDFEESLEMARTGFRRNSNGYLYLRDFQILACMKQAVQTLGLFKSTRGLKGYIEAAVRFSPREIILHDSYHKPITEPSGIDEIQGRVITMQGPRSILSEKEYVENAECEFSIEALVDNEKGKVLMKNLPAILRIMENVGLGSVRSRLEGRFVATIV